MSSSGLDAVELAASAGLHLDEWQCGVLDGALGERADGKWAAPQAALIVPRQNGKGAVLEARALAGMFLFSEQLVLWSAHEFKTAREAFLRIRSIIDGSDDLSRMVRSFRTGAGDEGIELTNGSRLRFVARSRGSGRGFSADLVLLDEAYALTDDQMAALLPTLSARPNPQVWYTSSAPLVTSQVLRRLCKRGRSGESSSLFYAEWCAEQLAESEDRRAWADSNPGLGIRVSEEFIAQNELDALDDEDFRRERLGIWLEDAFASVIDLAIWSKLRDARSTMVDPVALAFDVSPQRKTAAIAAAGRRSDGKWHGEVIEHSVGTGWLVPRLLELSKKHRPCVIVVDGKSPAASLLPELEQAGLKVTTEPRKGSADIIVRTGTNEMAQACGVLYDLAHEDRFRHLDQPELTGALEGAAQRPLGDAWGWSRKESSNDITPLVAVTEALFGASVYGPKESAEPWFSFGFSE